MATTQTLQAMRNSLPQIKSTLRQLKAEKTALENLKKSILEACPTSQLSELTTLLTAIESGGRLDGLGEVWRLLSRNGVNVKSLSDWKGRGISQIDTEMRLLKEREGIIRAALPTPEQVNSAFDTCEGLKKDLAAQRETFYQNWTAFLTSLQSTVSAARTLVESKPSLKQAQQINRLIDDFGLAGPREAMRQEPIDHKDIDLAATLALLVQQVATHQDFDTQIEIRVQEAISKRDREADRAAKVTEVIPESKVAETVAA